MKLEVFVSYRFEDEVVVREAINRIRALCNRGAAEESSLEEVAFWFAPEIKGGDNYRKEIANRISSAHLFFLFLRDPGADPTWVMFETGLFLGRGQDQPGRLISFYPSSRQLPDPIADRHGLAKLDRVEEFFRKFFRRTRELIPKIGKEDTLPIYRNITDEEIREVAQVIVDNFTEGGLERSEDFLPTFRIETPKECEGGELSVSRDEAQIRVYLQRDACWIIGCRDPGAEGTTWVEFKRQLMSIGDEALRGRRNIWIINFELALERAQRMPVFDEPIPAYESLSLQRYYIPVFLHKREVISIGRSGEEERRWQFDLALVRVAKSTAASGNDHLRLMNAAQGVGHRFRSEFIDYFATRIPGMMDTEEKRREFIRSMLELTQNISYDMNEPALVNPQVFADCIHNIELRVPIIYIYCAWGILLVPIEKVENKEGRYGWMGYAETYRKMRQVNMIFQAVCSYEIHEQVTQAVYGQKHHSVLNVDIPKLLGTTLTQEEAKSKLLQAAVESWGAPRTQAELVESLNTLALEIEGWWQYASQPELQDEYRSAVRKMIPFIKFPPVGS